MARLIAGILVIASGVFLYFALTQPIVISRLVDLNTMIRVIYPENVFAATQPAKPALPAPAASAPAASAPAPAAPSTPPQTAAAPAAPAATASTAAVSPYEAKVTQYEKLFTTMVLGSDAAKKNFADLTQPKGYTAWQSARVLYDAGDVVSGTAIIAFSVVYPILKTLALLVMIIVNVKHKTALKLAEWTHKYTMLDVFVAAVTVVALSTQKLLEINTGPAIWWYIAYLITGFVSVWVLIRARGKDTPAAAA
jgi:Paraquat-inducible protein A